MYYQCKLRRGDAETVGWIAERGAKLGANIEIIADDKNRWEVIEVYKPGLTLKQLQDKQERDRHSLPSLEHARNSKAGR